MDIKGRVYDNSGNAVEGATVGIYDSSDDSLLHSVVTTSTGAFSKTDIADDTIVYVKVTSGTDVQYRRGDSDVQFENVCASVRHSPTATELTLSAAGLITITQDFHLVDTYDDAASDEVVTINGGYSNQILTIWAASSSRDVVIPVNASPAANGIYNNTAPFTMNITQDRAQLLFDDTLGYWILLNPRNVG